MPLSPIEQAPGTIQGFPNIPNIPVSPRETAPFPKEERRSVTNLSRFLREQYQNGLAMRRSHAVSWMMVQSYLRGIHHFQIRGDGIYEALPHDPRKPRSSVPILKPLYRHLMGFLTSNVPGVTAMPVAGAKSAYRSARAENILQAWMKEENLMSFMDRFNQTLLAEGMAGIHRYFDMNRKTVGLRLLPGSEIFPIPFDARSPEETDGIIHASVVTKGWLELQDDLYQRQTGSPPPRRMADKAKMVAGLIRLDLPSLGTSVRGSRFEGAIVLTAWMKETESTPGGEYAFMVEDEIYRHAVGIDPESGRPRAAIALPNGKIPVEIVYYDKNPHDFWGYGIETVIPAQMMGDRIQTLRERNVRLNRPLTFINEEFVRWDHIQDADAPIIPMTNRVFGEGSGAKNPPVLHFPTRPLGKDTDTLFASALEFGDRAAGLRSGISFGQSEGRTDGGPANTILGQNATASLNPVTQRTDAALGNTYPEVLDMIGLIWPDEKKIRVAGPNNVGREISISRKDIPSSQEVILIPKPTLPGGRQAMVSMLFSLKQLPSEDGVIGGGVKDRELRQSLQELNLLPPGLDLFNKPEARIQARINNLIGDGQTPTLQATDPRESTDRLGFEDHRVSVEMLKLYILDDEGWDSYSDVVKKNLVDQVRFHFDRINMKDHPTGFDDASEEFDSVQMEQFLSAAEADLETDEGDFGNIDQLLGAL